MPPIDERQLVDDITRGDRAALGQVLNRYQHRLYNVVWRMVGHREDAAEITQETMLKIVEHVDDFRGQSSILTWMTRIAMNQSISHLRKRRTRQTVSLDADGPDNAVMPSSALRHRLPDEREPGPPESVERSEMTHLLKIAISRLDDDFRGVLVLRDIDQMDYRQICEVLDIPVGTVKSRLFRARLALRHEMLKLCPPPSSASRPVGESTSRG